MTQMSPESTIQFEMRPKSTLWGFMALGAPSVGWKARFCALDLTCFTPEQRTFVLEVTGHQNPCLLMVNARAYCPPYLKPDDVSGWMEFLHGYCSAKAAAEQDLHNAVQRLQWLTSLSDQELLMHHQELQPEFGRHLPDEHQHQVDHLMDRYQDLLIAHATSISDEHRSWIEQHGSETLKKQTRKLPKNMLILDLLTHYPESWDMLYGHPLIAEKVVDLFLYEYVQHTFNGAFFAPEFYPESIAKTGPAAHFQKAQTLGGTLMLCPDEGDVLIPRGFEAKHPEVHRPYYGVLVPWKSAFVMHHLGPASPPEAPSV